MFRVTRVPCARSATTYNIPSSATSVILMRARPDRRGATIFNDSTQVLYVRLGESGGGVASTSDYTIQMATLTYYEVPFDYTGPIYGIWAAANGNARVTEVY